MSALVGAAVLDVVVMVSSDDPPVWLLAAGPAGADGGGHGPAAGR